MDTSLEVDVEMILEEASLPTLASGPSGTTASTFSQILGASTTSQPTKITWAMILKMGQSILLMYKLPDWRPRYRG